jgi:hypothetical protein
MVWAWGISKLYFMPRMPESSCARTAGTNSILLAEKVLDLVTQAFLLLIFLSLLVARTTVPSVLFLVDVSLATTLIYLVSQDHASKSGQHTPVWKLS